MCFSLYVYKSKSEKNRAKRRSPPGGSRDTQTAAKVAQRRFSTLHFRGRSPPPLPLPRERTTSATHSSREGTASATHSSKEGTDAAGDRSRMRVAGGDARKEIVLDRRPTSVAKSPTPTLSTPDCYATTSYSSLTLRLMIAL